MPNFGYHEIGTAQLMFESSATQRHPLGTRVQTADGRAYRYALAGASDLVAGNVIQSAAPIANHLANTPPAVPVTQMGSPNFFTYTPGATVGAANLYAEGYMQVDTTPGNGYVYTVESHPAIASATAFTLTLMKDDPIQVALTTSSRVGLMHNPYKSVIQCPTVLTGVVVGVAPYIITAAQYGWIQTWGCASVLINGTPAVGVLVMNGATTAGSVDVITTTNLVTSNVVGRMRQVGVSTKNNYVDLCISP